MRLFGRTVLVVLGQKSVVSVVSSTVCLGACVARVETINGCRIHRQYASCCYLLLLLWTYISTHHQQARLSSGRTCEGSVILTWLNYYAVIQGWIKTVSIGSVNGRTPSCSSIIQSLLSWATSSLTKQNVSSFLVLCQFFIVAGPCCPINCEQILVKLLLSNILVCRSSNQRF